MAAMVDDEDGVVIGAEEVAGGGGGASMEGVVDDGDDVPVVHVPSFPVLSAAEMAGGKDGFRRVRVPPHRLTPLRAEWNHIMQPIVEHLLLQIRYNPKSKSVELKTSEHTKDPGAIQKAADFIQVYMLGFEVQDAVALLRLDDLYVDTFEVKDVKTLQGDHLSRAIGRIAGQVRDQTPATTCTRGIYISMRHTKFAKLSSLQLNLEGAC